MGSLMAKIHSSVKVRGYGKLDARGRGSSDVYQEVVDWRSSLANLTPARGGCLTKPEWLAARAFLVANEHWLKTAPSALLHSDIHPSNLFVSHRPHGTSEVSCIIDWGDLCAGSPYADFCCLFYELFDHKEEVSAATAMPCL